MLTGLGVTARAGETIELPAKDAVISGNGHAHLKDAAIPEIAGWDSTNSIVTWKISEVPKGTYKVIAVYSCDDMNAGSKLAVTVGNQHADFVVESTTTWMNYKEADLGPVMIRRPGPVDVTVRITDKPHRFGINLRALKLVPAY